jgi:hypothetical protein
MKSTQLSILQKRLLLIKSYAFLVFGKVSLALSSPEGMTIYNVKVDALFKKN